MAVKGKIFLASYKSISIRRVVSENNLSDKLPNYLVMQVN